MGGHQQKMGRLCWKTSFSVDGFTRANTCSSSGHVQDERPCPQPHGPPQHSPGPSSLPALSGLERLSVVPRLAGANLISHRSASIRGAHSLGPCYIKGGPQPSWELGRNEDSQALRFLPNLSVPLSNSAGNTCGHLRLRRPLLSNMEGEIFSSRSSHSGKIGFIDRKQCSRVQVNIIKRDLVDIKHQVLPQPLAVTKPQLPRPLSGNNTCPVYLTDCPRWESATPT